MTKETDSPRKLALRGAVKYLRGFVREAKMAIYDTNDTYLSAEELVYYLERKYDKKS